MTIQKEIKQRLKQLANPERATVSKRFFKTGKGQYGEGDIFIGISVPDIRAIAKEYYKKISAKDLLPLLHSPIHEERLLALIIVVYQFQHASKNHDEKTRKKLFDLYIKNTKYINNWDLVDTSAEHIVGAYLHDKPRLLLKTLAGSSNLWQRRIAIIATFYFLKQKNPTETIHIAQLLLKDKHDLIHKAVGWTLREMGKKCGEKCLKIFLDQYATRMPRTMLRYAIERLPKKEKMRYTI